MEIGSFTEQFLWRATQMQIREVFKSVVVTLN